MELLYLWIEDYKNIYRQGFNFSPLYDFEFTPTKEENGKVIEGTLKDNITKEERETKEKFYKDFFKDETTENTDYGISNVTAIVGENGAGKSSLLDIIRTLWIEGRFINTNQEKYVTEFIFITNEFTFHTSNIEIKDYQLSQEKIIVDNEYLEAIYCNKTESFSSIVYYSDILTFKEITTDDFDISTNKLLQKSPQRHERDTQSKGIIGETLSLKRDDVIRQIKLLQNNSLRQKIPFEAPNKIQLFLHSRNHSILISNKYNVQGLLKEKLDNWTKNENLKENIFLHFFCSLTITSNNFFDISLEEINAIFSEDYHQSCLTLLNKCKEKLNPFNKREINFDEASYFLKFINDFNFKDYTINSSSILFDLDDANFQKFYLTTLPLPIFDHEWVIKQNDIIYLSSGESTVLRLLARFYEIIDIDYTKILLIGDETEQINISEANSLVIIIDEGELGLHPQWQKQYLKILLETLPKIFPNKQIQLILTSHSPFLVSDLPRENVIFLEKEESTGMCKVSKLDSMKETFGANIHTLLTDSFFMKGGLVGEFAKSKINWAMELLLDKKEIKPEDKEKIRYIISCIGEPVIRHKLMQLYDEKVKFSVEDRIKELQKQIDDLKNNQ